MFIPHITTEGERWDQLAWRYYGDAHRYQPIVQANPHVPLDAETATEDLPPWMR